MTLNVGGDIDAFHSGAVLACLNALVNINGNITAGYLGAVAFLDVQIFIGGNIVVTSLVPYEDGGIFVGAASGFGGKITIDGTITAVNYVALYFEQDSVDEKLFNFVIINANQNKTSTSKAGYLEYNDSDGDVLFASFVWVKDVTTPVPGTGDSTTLWLLLGALMAAALGTGLVLAYRKRAQQEEA